MNIIIMTGEKYVANHWSVRSSNRRGGDRVKGLDGEGRYLSQLQVSVH